MQYLMGLRPLLWDLDLLLSRFLKHACDLLPQLLNHCGTSVEPGFINKQVNKHGNCRCIASKLQPSPCLHDWLMLNTYIKEICNYLICNTKESLPRKCAGWVMYKNIYYYYTFLINDGRFIIFHWLSWKEFHNWVKKITLQIIRILYYKEIQVRDCIMCTNKTAITVKIFNVNTTSL